jgi:Tol biopolymer transport system component
MAQIAPDPLQQAIAHLRAGNTDQARPILINLVQQNPASEPAWYLLSLAVSDPKQQIDCLQRVLKVNPDNVDARDRLAKLTTPPYQPLTQPITPPLIANEPLSPSSAPTIVPSEALAPDPAEPFVPAKASAKTAKRRAPLLFFVGGVIALLIIAIGAFVIVRLAPFNKAVSTKPAVIAYLVSRTPDNPVDYSRDIYVMNIDGTNKYSLTTDLVGRVTSKFSWSPDGTRIAFLYSNDPPSADNPDLRDLYVINLDSTDTVNLTPSVDAGVTDFYWSPDSTRILFQARGNHLIDADGSDLVALTGKATTGGELSGWSPDGSKFIVRQRTSVYEAIRFYIVNASDLQPTPIQDELDIFAGIPSWSPDGTSILYVDYAKPSESELNMAQADGSAVVDLAEDAQVRLIDKLSTPQWSSDGLRILFAASPRYNRTDVFLINSDGTGLTNLTENHAGSEHFAPQWTPDGRILFVGNPTGPLRTLIMNADGSNPRRLLFVYPMATASRDFAVEWSPVEWSPDGKLGIIHTDSGSYWFDIESGRTHHLEGLAHWRPVP